MSVSSLFHSLVTCCVKINQCGAAQLCLHGNLFRLGMFIGLLQFAGILVFHEPTDTLHRALLFFLFLGFLFAMFNIILSFIAMEYFNGIKHEVSACAHIIQCLLLTLHMAASGPRVRHRRRAQVQVLVSGILLFFLLFLLGFLFPSIIVCCQLTSPSSCLFLQASDNFLYLAFLLFVLAANLLAHRYNLRAAHPL